MKMNKFLPLLLAACLLFTGCGAFEDNSELKQQLKQEGMALQAAGDYSGAIAKYGEALKLTRMKVGPEEVDISYYKASAQYHSGDLEGAIETYSALIALKGDVNSYLARGMLYVEAKEAEKAEADLNKALKETNDPLIKGIIYNVVDDTEKAKACFEEAKAAGNVDAIFYLAGIYEEAGDANYAMILLEEYIASGKASAEGYLTVGRQYFEDGSYAEALNTIQAGIALGNSGVLKSLLQEEIACYEKLGEYETAREKAAIYLEQYPEDTVIQKEYEFLKSR